MKLERRLSELDKEVLEFLEVLEEENLLYVLVGGYVAILLGRSRATEDVDVLVEELDREETRSLVRELEDRGYWCINAEGEEIFEMVSEGLSVRFAEEEKVIPNFETGFALDEYETRALNQRLKVELSRGELYISPLELQIAYKLYLGAEKDFEDALHLFELFREEIDTAELENLVEEFDVREEFDELEGA